MLARVALSARVAAAVAAASLIAGAGSAAEAAEREAVLPLFVEDQYARDVPVLIHEGGGAPPAPRIEEAPLEAALQTWVETPVLGDIHARAEAALGRRWVPLSALEAAGVRARFDERTLELRLSVPAGLRRSDTISITRPFELTDPASLLAPATVSAYVNANVGQDFVYGEGASAGARARQPLRSELDGAANYRGFVLEGAGSFTESAPGGGWTRGDFRLVRDQPSSATRYELGDLSYPVQGFQRFRPMAGAAAVTEFGLQPYKTFTPVSQQDIVLRSRSTVRVYMNGQLLQTLELPAGRHSLRDFPFSSGVNDVLLEITDDVGRVETIRIPYFAADLLLSAGTHQLTYAAGASTRQPDSLTGGSRRYDTGRAAFLLSHRYGFSERLTAGAYMQGDRAQKVAGVPVTTATPYGSWTLEPALSHAEDAGTGLAGRLGYQFVDYHGTQGSQRNLTLSVEARAPRFAALDEAPDPLHSRYDVGAGYGQEIFARTSASLSAGYRWAPGTDLAGRSVSAGLARSWLVGFDTSLLFTHARDLASSTPRNTVFFLLTWTLPEDGHYFTATANSDNGFGRVQWNYNPASNNVVGGFNSTVGVERTTSDRKADARVEYSGNRGRISATHQTQSAAGGTGLAQRTGASASAAIVMADGRFGLGRTVTDSFALVATRESIAGQSVQLNPQFGGRFEAESGPLGGAVSPDLISYRYTQLHIGTEALAPGAGPVRENYVLQPTYRSGFYIPLGSPATVLARGRLLDRRGQAVRLWTGELARADGAAEPVTVFTNREGRFWAEGLSPGRYRLEPLKLEFDIPADAAGIYDLGGLSTGLEGEKP